MIVVRTGAIDAKTSSIGVKTAAMRGTTAGCGTGSRIAGIGWRTVEIAWKTGAIDAKIVEAAGIKSFGAFGSVRGLATPFERSDASR